MTADVDWAVELLHTWPLLAADHAGRMSFAPLPISNTDGNVRLGVDKYGRRHLLVPIGNEEIRADDAEGALTVLLQTYTFQGKTSRHVDVFCVRPDLFKAFDNVLIDILGQIERTSAPASATVKAVERWRTLLATRRGTKLTLNEQMSLFAELFILDLVTQGSEIPAHTWRGPRREPHDILMSECAIEVKAVGETSTSVSIHGIEQLDPPGCPLALAVVTIEEDSSGRRLPELVDAVLARVDDRGEALWLITAAGFEPSEADRYDERFAVHEIGHVEASDAIPRIVESSFGSAGVPAGLHRIDYRIDLDVLNPLLTRGESALRSWCEGSC